MENAEVWKSKYGNGSEKKGLLSDVRAEHWDPASTNTVI